LIQEVVITVPRALIAESVNLIIFIAGRGRARRVEEIVRVTGLDAHGYCLESVSHLAHSRIDGEVS
jgi:Flp pilus assembly CpaF family ATPase